MWCLFAYEEEQAGRYAACSAVAIAEALISGLPCNLLAILSELRRLHETNRFGPSTSAIVQACDWPTFKL